MRGFAHMPPYVVSYDKKHAYIDPYSAPRQRGPAGLLQLPTLSKIF